MVDFSELSIDEVKKRIAETESTKCKYAEGKTCPTYSALENSFEDVFINATIDFGCFDVEKCKDCGVYKLIEDRNQWKEKYENRPLRSFDAEDI